MSNASEKYSRVQAMILDNSDTWDLSPRDKEALRFVLGLINSMADTLARSSGLPVPTVIERHGKFVEMAQKRFGTTGDDTQ